MPIVQSLTHNGMGRLADNRFIPRVIPGEDVEVLSDGSVRILTPSTHRVAASCRHYKTCGGCALQHASDNFVAVWKRDLVCRALSARGITCDVLETKISPERSRRRVKFSARRTKKAALVGFYQRASETLVTVPDCRLVLPEIAALIPELEELTTLIASRKETITFTVLQTEFGPDVAIDTQKEPDPRAILDAGKFAQKANFARISWNGEVCLTLASPTISIDGIAVQPPPGSFLQATEHGERHLQTFVKESVGTASQIIDLFSGCGTFTLPLARRAEIHAVEGDQSMLDALSDAWRGGHQLKKVSVQARDLFRNPILSDELDKFECAVIDPPRAGAEAQIAELAKSGLKRIAMISCNPTTFARDAATLIEAGFQMGPVDVVDQFRWSSHVEVTAAFSRKR